MLWSSAEADAIIEIQEADGIKSYFAPQVLLNGTLRRALSYKPRRRTPPMWVRDTWSSTERSSHFGCDANLRHRSRLRRARPSLSRAELSRRALTVDVTARTRLSIRVEFVSDGRQGEPWPGPVGNCCSQS
jgi:hypothetical protein